MTTALRVQAVSKSFRSGPTDVEVLTGADLHVQPGQIVALLGPSGCGKTTLLRLIAGFDRADAGTIAIDDRVVAGPGVHVPPERRRVGIVPQEGAVFPHLSVRGNVGFGLTQAQRRAGRGDDMLRLVGLESYAERMPHELSGGQLQRVALARALAPRPSVVLLDEPFTALDTGLRAAVRAEVGRALRATGATVLLITHDQEEALSMADEVAIMSDGRVIQQDTPLTIYRTPATVSVARFLGDAVLLDAVSNGTTAHTPLGPLQLSTPADPQAHGQALLRPEQLWLRPADSSTEANAVVDSSNYYGHDSLVTATLLEPDHPITLTSRLLGAPTHLTPGTRARITVSGPAHFYPSNPPN